MHKPIWRSFAPTKCKIFSWLALKKRIWTSDRRYKHGMQDRPSACFTCLQEEDNVEHILVQCVFARRVWYTCLQEASLQLEEPQRGSTLENWWLQAREGVVAADKRKFDTLVILVSWMLWKHRNSRVFENTREQCSVTQLTGRIKGEFHL
uniref:Uncharacterized protein n=1 Tax=Avena sativa TaxID=4498 RepID=A0ACD5XAR4_AVESA